MSSVYILSRPCQAVPSLPQGMMLGSDAHSASEKTETETSELTWPSKLTSL